MNYYERLDISPETLEIAEKAEGRIKTRFSEIEKTAEYNTAKVLTAFKKHRVSDAMFAVTTGYGYDDLGRDTLDKIYAEIFGTESALVRTGFVNGTHAITAALFSAVKPGDVLMSATGTPYDTLQSVIGITGNYPGSLKYYGIDYTEVALAEDGKPNIEKIAKTAADKRVKAVTLQRSRGYSTRPALTIDDIKNICDAVKSVNPEASVIADNCYGEFTDIAEPTEVGVDLMAGSLIKNPGGGLASTGGYLAGSEKLIEAAAMRLTAPGIGGECGSSIAGNRLLYQGLFMAPHTVGEALKTAIFCASVMELMGYNASPSSIDKRSDIIETIRFEDPKILELFCKGIQAGSPVDAYVTPEAWDMPGYEDKVIMAAGTFVQGASIELSCDGPMRPPYVAYMQGGLTYESGKFGIIMAADALLKNRTGK